MQVGPWYRWAHMQQVYATSFKPIGDELNWIAPTNFPALVPDPHPDLVRKRGKPRKKRFRMEMDLQGSCGICGILGHNARSCPNNDNCGI